MSFKVTINPLSPTRILTIVKAIRVAAEVRDQIKNKLDEDDLEKTFGDIELFLSVFQEDQNIEKSSVELLVAILAAAEGVIGFFLSRQGKSQC